MKAEDWIRISDKRPEDGKRVLVFMPNGSTRSGQMEDGYFFSEFYSNIEYVGRPTHWMPLVEPKQ